MGAGGSTAGGTVDAKGGRGGTAAGAKGPVVDASKHPMKPNKNPATNKVGGAAVVVVRSGANVLPCTLHTRPVINKKGVGTVTPGEALMKVVQSALPPPATAGGGGGTGGKNDDKEEYGWFVESDNPQLLSAAAGAPPGGAVAAAGYDMYNEESTARLEEAFLGRVKRVNVAFKKNLYTVDLELLYQVPASGAAALTPEAILASPAKRRVRRAPVEVVRDAATGQITQRREKTARAAFRDPFGDSDEEAAEAAAGEEAGEGGAGGAEASEGGRYPVIRATVKPHAAPIYTMDVLPAAAAPAADPAKDALTLLTGAKDGTLYEWSFPDARVHYHYQLPAAAGSGAAAKAAAAGGKAAPRPAVLSALYSPSGRLVLVGTDDRLGRVYLRPAAAEGDGAGPLDAATVTPVVPAYELQGHTHKVYCCVADATEARAVTISMDGHLNVYDLAAGGAAASTPLRPVISDHCHTSHIFAVCASRLSPHLCISCGDDALLCVHDLRLGGSTVAHRAKGHTGTLWSCDINTVYNDVYFCSAGMDAAVMVWDARNLAAPIISNTRHSKPVHCCRFTPQGRGVLSSSKDNDVMLTELIDMANGNNVSAHNAVAAAAGTGGAQSSRVIWKAKAHAASVFRAFLVESVLGGAARNSLVTCSGDATVGVWDWPLAAAQGW